MYLLRIGGRRYAQFERLRQESGLVHGFSTRPLDVSVRDGERAAACAARRRQMALDLGLEPGAVRCCLQVHAGRIAVVNDVAGAAELAGCDGVVTVLRGVGVMGFSADCPLVLVYDRARGALGLAHASWRCTVRAITRRLVETMREAVGCEPGDLLAGIGPSAGPQRYEVQRDVYDAAAELPERERLFHERDGRLYFDLWEANRRQLVGAGIPAENIEVAGICTMTRTDLFYSYRVEGPGCGHFGLLAGLVRA